MLHGEASCVYSFYCGMFTVSPEAMHKTESLLAAVDCPMTNSVKGGPSIAIVSQALLTSLSCLSILVHGAAEYTYGLYSHTLGVPPDAFCGQMVKQQLGGSRTAPMVVGSN